MIFYSLSEIYSEKQSVLSRLQKSVTGLSPEQLVSHPQEGRWSISEVLEHVLLVDASLLKLINALLGKVENAGTHGEPANAFPMDLRALVDQSNKEKYIARENAQPTGKVSASDSLRESERIQGELLSLQPRLESIDLSSISFPHFALGPLTLGQWFAFIGIHEERHLRQIEGLIASKEFLQTR